MTSICCFQLVGFFFLFFVSLAVLFFFLFCLLVFVVALGIALAWRLATETEFILRRTLEFINYDRVQHFSTNRRASKEKTRAEGTIPIDSYVKNSISSSRFIADLLFIRFNFIAHFRTTCWIQCN